MGTAASLAQQVTTSAEQLGERPLPARRSIWHKTSSAVAPLAAGVAQHHVQDRRSHVQSPSDVNTSIPQQPHKPHRTHKTPALSSRTSVVCS